MSAGYFETVGTRVLRGRPINQGDTPTARHVAVVNESFVRRFFLHTDPLGQTVGIGDSSHNSDFEIVGVVEDVKYTGATQPDVRPMLFMPAFQTVAYADATSTNVQARSTLLHAIVLQVAPGTRNVEAGVRQALSGVDPDLTVLRVLPMISQVRANFRLERLMARLTSVYSLLALALAALGLYGVTAYGVSQRTREIGVRMALGANRVRIIRTCLRGPLIQTCAGLAIGGLAAFLTGRAISAQLYGIGGLDLTVFGTAVLVLTASAGAAAALPARRAATVNPAAALRGE